MKATYNTLVKEDLLEHIKVCLTYESDLMRHLRKQHESDIHESWFVLMHRCMPNIKETHRITYTSVN